MPISTIKARLPYDAATIWRIIYATLFTITISQPFERYEFDLENENIKGHWCGLLSERNGQTEIIFTETVFAKKWYLKPFVKTYLRKQQSVYLKDLRQKLLETVR